MNPCFKIGKFFWKAAGEKSFHSCSSLCLEGSYGRVEAGQGEDVLVLQREEIQCANKQASAGNFIEEPLKSCWKSLNVAIHLFIVSLTTEKLFLRYGKCTWLILIFFGHFKDEHKASDANPEIQLPSEILVVPDCAWRNGAGAGVGTSL